MSGRLAGVDVAAVNRRVVAQFREGVAIEGMHRERLLLLTTTGRRSRQEHTVPMMFHRDGERVLVIASNAGAARHPDWYLNLAADPRVTVEVGDEPGGAPHPATAVTLEAEERAASWEMLKGAYPFFADHEAATERTIPVVELRSR